MSAEDFRRALLDARLLVDGGTKGIYHRSFQFERVVRNVGEFVSAAGRAEPSERLYLSSIETRDTLERSGYATSFPNLIGLVSSFSGTESDVPAYLEAVEAGGSWVDHMAPTELAMCSAGCHPVYPLLVGAKVPSDGARYEIQTWCFRHEPSDDPARMQSFRQHEFVYVGTPDGAVEHRDAWLARGIELLSSLGLDVASVVANDPFFGRAGRLLAANQRVKELKFELVAPISSETPGAVASSNCHEDHFGTAFDLRLENGDVAHSSCIGFGLERISLALFLAHGFDVLSWPDDVRQLLALDRDPTEVAVP